MARKLSTLRSPAPKNTLRNQSQLRFPFSLFDSSANSLAGSDDVEWCVQRVVDRFRAGFSGSCLVPVVAEVLQSDQLVSLMNLFMNIWTEIESRWNLFVWQRPCRILWYSCKNNGHVDFIYLLNLWSFVRLCSDRNMYFTSSLVLVLLRVCDRGRSLSDRFWWLLRVRWMLMYAILLLDVL